MAIETVNLINLIGKISSLDSALVKIAQSEMLHIEPVEKSSKIKDFEALNEKNPYAETFEKTVKILNMLKINPRFNNYESLQTKNFDEIKNLIFDLFEKIDTNLKTISNLSTKIKLMQKSLKQLNKIRKFDSKLSEIFNASFVDACFGRMPLNNFLKLSHFKNENFFFIPFDKDKTFCWGLFIIQKQKEKGFQQIAQSLYFEKQYPQEKISRDPKLATDELKKEISNLKTYIENLETETENYKTTYEQVLVCIYSKLKTMNTSFLLKKFATCNGKYFYINGFILKKNIKAFSQLFENMDDVVVEILPSNHKKNLTPPVKLKTFVLFRPFETLTETFGSPSYKSVNPTSFVGLVYCILFGIMFGDFGQGACLIAAGIAAWKIKKMAIGPVLAQCGVASCIFGLIYDSFFGFEGLFEKFWKKFHFLNIFPFNPIKGKNALTILAISLLIGMILIVVSISINIFINLKNKNFKEAILSSNGLVGLTIYGGVGCAAISGLAFKLNIVNSFFLVFVVFLPIILIFLSEPISNFINSKIFKKTSKNKFSFLNSTFETIETLLNYFTNTLSFLRVGGFAMSHAALMLVIIKFFEKASNIITSPLILIVGNVFVLALEGLVVSIQVLRLVYYEMFSRFYKSDGKPFNPAKINF